MILTVNLEKKFKKENKKTNNHPPHSPSKGNNAKINIRMKDDCKRLLKQRPHISVRFHLLLEAFLCNPNFVCVV